MALFAWGVFILAAFLLSIFVVFAWRGKGVITIERFRRSRIILAIFASAYAAFTIFRLSIEVAIPRTMPDAFVPELISYLIFWILAPPVWFFSEYLAIENDRIDVADKTASLALAKTYSDYASKIWAAVLALMAALVALKT